MSTPPPPDDGPPAGVWAELTASVTGLHAHLGAQETRREESRRRNHPIRGPLAQAGPVPAAGPLVLDLGAPAMGRRWTLLSLSVSDAASVTTAVPAGTADLYVGSALAYGPGGWRDRLSALPRATLYDAEQVVVIPADHLVVVVTGATPGQVLMARAEVLDYPLMTGRAVQPL